MSQSAPASPNQLLEVRDLKVHFPTRNAREMVKALDGVSFHVDAGETLGVIGESGCGKTTLGRALVSLVKSTSGEVLHNGNALSRLPKIALQEMRKDFQIIFQDPHAALNPRMRAIESVCEPLMSAGGKRKDEVVQLALRALDKVGISPELSLRYPHQLSGGQKQRINIARVLTLRPRLIVCDEVVAALDVSIRGDVLNLFSDLQKEFGIAYVFITHDLSVVSHISDRIAVAYLGRFMELGPTDALTQGPLHPYTAALLSAEPVASLSQRQKRHRILLEGEIPSPIDPPSGCRFRTRCPMDQAQCELEEPAWRQLRPDHWVACHFASPDGLPDLAQSRREAVAH